MHIYTHTHTKLIIWFFIKNRNAKLSMKVNKVNCSSICVYIWWSWSITRHLKLCPKLLGHPVAIHKISCKEGSCTPGFSWGRAKWLFLWNIRTYKNRGGGGSPPAHNTLGFFSWRQSLKLHREKKKTMVYVHFGQMSCIWSNKWSMINTKMSRQINLVHFSIYIWLFLLMFTG